MKRNGDTVVVNPSKKPTSGCKIVLTSIFFATVAVVVYHRVISPVFHERLKQEETSKESVQYVQNGVVDEEVVSLFVTYDEDLDGVLDMSEFVKVANTILNRKVEDDHQLEKPNSNGFIQDWQEDNGEKLTIISHFSPLVLSTMSKYSDETSDDTGHENQLQGLKSWTNATASMATFSVRKFEAFLPDPAVTPLLGQLWYIIESRLDKGGPGLTNDRYYPSTVKGRLAIIYKLLAMFHPRPFLLTRFGPQGTVACVRAENKDYWDIVFRIHAEYQLNEPPLLPFWFTPGQFLGNIVIKKDGSHVQSFHLAVPNNKSLNVDMEWLVPEEPHHTEKETKSDKEDSKGDENMEVDIGFLPQMELQSKMPSALLNEEGMDAASSSVNFHDDNIKWDKEISFEEAYKAMERQFYGFKKVPYYPFKDAINQARAEDKLVHHILLWGALDDQSC